MKRAIFKKFILIISLALFLSSSIFGVTISKIILDNRCKDLLYALKVADLSLDYNGDLNDQLNALKQIKNGNTSRFTIINMDGTVLADSEVSNPVIMENHIHREEIQEALKNGAGFSRRYSDTLNLSMLYVAYLSNNDNYILRIAEPFSGLEQYLGLLLPALVISIGITLLISSILANSFARSIAKPLREIAEEMTKLKDDKPEFHFNHYEFEEMNVIADTTMQMLHAVKESMNQIEFEKMIRQEFFSNASHELKTPITSISGYVELLENDMVTDEKLKKDFLSRIKKETTNMTNLINDILMISRLETKEVTVSMHDVRICPLLSDVCSTLTPLATECQVTLETNCKPLTIYANEGQIRELLNNLINNAIKYNKPGGKVFVTITSEGNDFIIIVEDTGVGIPEEAQARIFERFYRVDRGRSKKMGGTGLGLSIVKHVVNYYNGSIQLESQVMKGTKFTIRLPKKQGY